MPAAASGQDSRAAEYVLTLSCPDRVGIVHAVAAYLHQAGCNVLDSQQFGDRTAGRFFMRVHVESLQPPAAAGGQASTATSYQDLYSGFIPVAAEFAMEWELHDTAVQPRVLILVSKAGHCLNDLLYRRAAESLRIDIPLVVGNHPDLAALAAAHGVAFEHVPADPRDPLSAQRAEGRLLDLVSELGIDFVVLARYMRILSPGLCAKLPGRIINIHHSFLPSFKGARPYHQAHAHGVKLIGATAHYVTADLDEGPIIEQEVARVDHTSSPEDLAAIGRDAERVALARAVRWHAEHRVLLHGRRTVIFR
ncbi:MAG TPA: formyltetrahydrofolate deformylase [Streptosporangiaceae bacterium]|nr:formyltetrahydrofolate deformylase [Streptosporangiaceae bacterium]